MQAAIIKIIYMAKLTTKQRKQIPNSQFAFPKKREEPIEDASHLRDAIARFDQVQGVTNQERDQAWERIKQAAARFNIHLNESDWRDLFKRNNRPIPNK